MDSEQETSEAEQQSEAEVSTGPQGPGAQLRAAREAKGLDLKFVAAETRIPVHHLEALENEAFENLPARAYALGFARNYARAVGLDEVVITDAVRAEMVDENERQGARVGGMEPGDPDKLPSSGLAWFGAFAAILLAAGVYTFYNTYYASGPGLGSLLAGEEAASEGDTAALSAADGDTGSGSALNPEGQVVFTALDDEIWVRFFVEGGDVLLETTMARGDEFRVPKNVAGVQLNTGRPQFLSITIDGKDVPKLSEEQVTLVQPVTAAALIARYASASAPAAVPVAQNSSAARAQAAPARAAPPSAPSSSSASSLPAGQGAGPEQQQAAASPDPAQTGEAAAPNAAPSAPQPAPDQTTAPAPEPEAAESADAAPPAN